MIREACSSRKRPSIFVKGSSNTTNETSCLAKGEKARRLKEILESLDRAPWGTKRCTDPKKLNPHLKEKIRGSSVQSAGFSL